MDQTLKDLEKLVIKFRDEREWKQYHSPKSLAISLMLEAAEVLDHFKWKTDDEMWAYLKSAKRQEVAEELADVLHNVLLMTGEFDIDLEKTFIEKMKKNAVKYPVTRQI